MLPQIINKYFSSAVSHFRVLLLGSTRCEVDGVDINDKSVPIHCTSLGADFATKLHVLVYSATLCALLYFFFFFLTELDFTDNATVKCQLLDFRLMFFTK